MNNIIPLYLDIIKETKFDDIEPGFWSMFRNEVEKSNSCENIQFDILKHVMCHYKSQLPRLNKKYLNTSFNTSPVEEVVRLALSMHHKKYIDDDILVDDVSGLMHGCRMYIYHTLYNSNINMDENKKIKFVLNYLEFLSKNKEVYNDSTLWINHSTSNEPSSWCRLIQTASSEQLKAMGFSLKILDHLLSFSRLDISTSVSTIRFANILNFNDPIGTGHLNTCQFVKDKILEHLSTHYPDVFSIVAFAIDLSPNGLYIEYPMLLEDYLKKPQGEAFYELPFMP